MFGSSRDAENHFWPCFVDALSALVAVVLFSLMLFFVMHISLGHRLNLKETHLGRVYEELTATKKRLERQQREAQQGREKAQSLLGMVNALNLSLESKETALSDVLSQRDLAYGEIEKLKTNWAKREAALQEVLDQKEKIFQGILQKKKEEIDSLTLELKRALENEVRELRTYRSRFFGDLKKALGDQPCMRVVGDRFVFQSEILFALGEATLGEKGREALASLAKTLKKLLPKIPPHIQWVLRVDGHTDIMPIQTAQFPSNWELSVARALAVVKFLIDAGVPAQRLMAAGFGEHHPLEKGTDEKSRAKNRRIELRLDQ